MAKKKRGKQVSDYRHQEKRKNLPPAALAAQGQVRDLPPGRYGYDPHLPPVLRFDETGAADQLPELLAEARRMGSSLPAIFSPLSGSGRSRTGSRT